MAVRQNLIELCKKINDAHYEITPECAEYKALEQWITDEEIEVIRKYIKRFHIKEQKRNLPLAEPMLDLMCPFLDNSKKCEKCTIYEVRPHICRQFSCDPKQRPQLDLSYGLKALVMT